jgi:hypothetical protein
VEMDACHILLGRPWQYDVDVTYKGRDNTYLFWWHGRKIVLVPSGEKSPLPKATTVEGLPFLIIDEGQIMEDVKEVGELLTSVVKGKELVQAVVDPAEVHLLKEFRDITPVELPNGLPPM